MESSGGSAAYGRDMSGAGASRAAKIRTAKHGKGYEKKELERHIAMGGLSQNEYWAKNVRSREDVYNFYKLYFPDYPDILCNSIARRIAGIIEKSRSGEPLTNEEIGYVTRSKSGEGYTWDPKEELKAHDMQARVNVAMKNLEKLT